MVSLGYWMRFIMEDSLHHQVFNYTKFAMCIIQMCYDLFTDHLCGMCLFIN